MTVELVEMTSDEFALFRERLVRDYAAENVSAGRARTDTAVDEAEETVSEVLPQGAATEGQYVFTLKEMDTFEVVGNVWLAVKESPAGRSVWVHDLFISEQHRRRGYGMAALRRVDEKALELRAESVGLHVFGHNQAAINLYRRHGFETTSIVMTRHLTDPG